MLDRDVRTAIQTIADDVQTPPFSKIQRMSARNRRLRRASVGIVPAGLLTAGLLAFVIQPGLPVTGERATGAPSAAPASSAAGVAATGPGPAQPGVSILRAGSFKTVAALVASSSLVAYVTATSTHSVTPVNGLPFTSTIMRIDRVVRGTAPKSDTLPLRQIGPANLDDPQKIVEPGHQYLAFLGRVSFSPGTTTGEWYVVGYMAGLYEVAGDRAIRLDDVRIWPLLPTDIALNEFESAINAAPTQQP